LLHPLFQGGDEGIPFGGDVVFDLEQALALAALGLFEGGDLLLHLVLLGEGGGLTAAALEIADLTLGVLQFFLKISSQIHS